MADGRDELRERFSARQRLPLTRRVDFKGYRARLNLRIPESISTHLQIIKLVTGEAKNAFCERVLREAVDSRINELKGRHGREAWEAIRTCAESGNRKEPSR